MEELASVKIKAVEDLASAKKEALARARAEAAEIMAETHDAAVEDSKALRSKLNEANSLGRSPTRAEEVTSLDARRTLSALARRAPRQSRLSTLVEA